MSFEQTSEFAIEVNGLGKCYQIYEKPSDRLKQMLTRGRKRYYKEFWALKDISFKIRRGETVGIIGRNGSGKSTLLQIICGTLNPTMGEVKVRGRVAALLELGAGFNPEFSGVENVYMAASLYGLSTEEVDQRFEAIATFADIGEHIHQPVKTYSSGMYVRLAFAVIAHVDADTLIIDEALAVGDAFFTEKCMRFLRGFMKQGTVLFVSHDTASVRSLCSDAIWIDKGHMLQHGKPKAVCDQYLEALFEHQQGKSVSIPTALGSQQTELGTQDQRQEFINASNLRNDLRLFEFDPDAPAFGVGDAQIKSVRFLDSQERPLAWIVGGESVILRVGVLVRGRLNSPIVGFYVRDKRGQNLFGDNTWLSYMRTPRTCSEGDFLEASFSFQMPRLPVGEYSIAVAVANGSQDEHVQHHWVHDAVIFKSETSSVSGGLIGIPMNQISLEIKESNV